MSDHVYKIVELVDSSPTSIEGAIQSAIARASSTVEKCEHRQHGVLPEHSARSK